MSASSGKGTGMHLDSSRLRFERVGTRKSEYLDDRVVEVRRLLRTDMTISDIAGSLHVKISSLRRFIKQRQLCRSLADRRNFISIQLSIAKLDERANKIRQHSSDGEQPHCRRTRADSSPAVGTNSQFVALPLCDETAVAQAPPRPAPSATAVSNSFSPGALSGSLPSGESDPSVTMDWAPGENPITKEIFDSLNARAT